MLPLRFVATDLFIQTLESVSLSCIWKQAVETKMVNILQCKLDIGRQVSHLPVYQLTVLGGI